MKQEIKSSNFKNGKFSLTIKTEHKLDYLITNFPTDPDSKCELCGSELKEYSPIIKCNEQTDTFTICNDCMYKILDKSQTHITRKTILDNGLERIIYGFKNEK